MVKIVAARTVTAENVMANTETAETAKARDVNNTVAGEPHDGETEWDPSRFGQLWFLRTLAPPRVDESTRRV